MSKPSDVMSKKEICIAGGSTCIGSFVLMFLLAWYMWQQSRPVSALQTQQRMQTEKWLTGTIGILFFISIVATTTFPSILFVKENCSIKKAWKSFVLMCLGILTTMGGLVVYYNAYQHKQNPMLILLLMSMVLAVGIIMLVEHEKPLQCQEDESSNNESSNIA